MYMFHPSMANEGRLVGRSIHPSDPPLQVKDWGGVNTRGDGQLAY
jgi:hypothetical protein